MVFQNLLWFVKERDCAAGLSGMVVHAFIHVRVFCNVVWLCACLLVCFSRARFLCPRLSVALSRSVLVCVCVSLSLYIYMCTHIIMFILTHIHTHTYIPVSLRLPVSSHSLHLSQAVGCVLWSACPFMPVRANFLCAILMILMLTAYYIHRYKGPPFLIQSKQHCQLQTRRKRWKTFGRWTGLHWNWRKCRCNARRIG